MTQESGPPVRWLHQLLRFGVVGILATALHSGIYLLAIHGLGFSAQLANVLGFLFAVTLSAVGHARITFDVPAEQRWPGMLRFSLIALLGFALNASFVFFTTHIIGAAPSFAVYFILFVTPVVTFLAAKFWAFSEPKQSSESDDTLQKPNFLV